MTDRFRPITRRRFVRRAGSGALALAAAGLLPPWARAAGLRLPGSGASLNTEMDLHIRTRRLQFGDRAGEAVTISGSVPGPLVRLREGGTATLRVHNELDEDTSIHWHGVILPTEMDGVPGVNFAGIRAGETFEYRYPVTQSGTYWYHSHSGLQEQLGHYGPIIIDPAEPDPFEYDRDHVVVLSDWTFENPYKLLARLKKQANYYNRQQRTVPELFREASRVGLGEALADRLRWGRMRMDATDLADVTGATYSFLMNGVAPEDNWTALFEPGEKVRLRFINAAAATFFDVRIPGLELVVVQTDGQNIEPVPVDEFRIAPAETYDVIVEPAGERAYTLFAEAMDRSGHARGTLAPREGMTADIPAPRRRATRTMADMGMGGMHGGEMDDMAMGHGAGAMEAPPEPAADAHAGHDMGAPRPAQRDMAGMQHDMHDMEAGEDSGDGMAMHGPDTHGPGNAGVAMMPMSRLHEPGIGLGNDGRRVLLYTDLRARDRLYEHRPPDREIELHATGNMERYMWSFDGKKFSEVDGPIEFFYGERLRIVFVNDTMMEHPLHLHGMWMHLDNGNGPDNPRKHTVNVKPGERMAVEVEVDAPGRWAFHCHLLYHMEAGMFRVVEVKQRPMHEHHGDSEGGS